jgi:type II secretory pathway component PulF
MMAESLSQFLTLYTWFPLAALLLFFLMIARFYEKFSNKRTFFRWFLAPILLFGIAYVRYASVERASDTLADLVAALAGLLLIGLCANLYRLMVWQRGSVSDDV